MASELQVRANARNAQRSTGPRTDEGKATAARNALRHGLSGAAVLLPQEDAEPLAALQDALRFDLQPCGPVEELLFDRVVAAAWRLRRAYLVERGVLERGDDQYDFSDNQKSLTQQLRRKFEDACQKADALGKLARYENALERGMHRALAELRRLQTSRANADAGGKILRNEPNSVVTPDGDGGNAVE